MPSGTTYKYFILFFIYFLNNFYYFSQVATDQNTLNGTTLSALARAVVAFKLLTDKLNPVIKPLMDSIKMEDNEQMQNAAGQTLARLLELCQSRTPCPNNKILKNLCISLCVDAEQTPKVNADDLDGILMLMHQQRVVEKSNSKKNATDIDQNNARALEIQRRGAMLALKAFCTHFGADLSSKVAYLWDMMMSIQTTDEDIPNDPAK